MEKVSSNKDHRNLVKLSILSILIFILLALLGTSCKENCDTVYSYVQYEPIYQSIVSIRASVNYDVSRPISTPGGLYYKDGYVYVIEPGTGIHVIDDRNLITPIPIGFVNIPGINGMAARGNYLYADSFMDLVVLDITDPSQIFETNRIQNVYENLLDHGFYSGNEDQIIVDWSEKVVSEVDCDDSYLDILAFDEFGGGYGSASDDKVYFDDQSGNDDGVGGSMARFVTSGANLYTVDQSALSLFDLTDIEDPQFVNRIEIGWGIETIFPHEDMLFIGANDGMYIYNTSTPSDPFQMSRYTHTTSCDPVVVDGDYAYVTLRSGNQCQGFTDQLEIINISDPYQPTLEKTYDMINPHGLAIDGSCLFICEGDWGLKTYQINASDPTEITLQNSHTNIHAFDVISLPGVLLMVGNDGFYQYQNECGVSFEYLSVIRFGGS